MKRVLFISLAVLLIKACSPSTEDRYIFEEERILDMETGEEYYLTNRDTLTVVDIEGESSEVPVRESPFSDNEEFENMLEDYQSKLEERKEQRLFEHKTKIKEERIERYSDYEDEELLKRFNELHENDAPFAQQMDIMAELVRREVVMEIDAPKLMELDTTMLNFDIEYQPRE